MLVESPGIHHPLLPLLAWQGPPAPSPKSFANHDNPCIWLMKTTSWCFPLPQHPQKCTKSANSSRSNETMPAPPAPPPAVPSHQPTTGPRPLPSSTITAYRQKNRRISPTNQPRIPPLSPIHPDPAVHPRGALTPARHTPSPATTTRAVQPWCEVSAGAVGRLVRALVASLVSVVSKTHANHHHPQPATQRTPFWGDCWR